ncbi:glycoside hydrolase family 17 protein [Methylophilus aquaticus]|uniref:Endo-1,3-beta-glucanase btgC n=1 Tax=Methylophilus aquaticus TaxID=1971610 RepID=A0ABT9JSP2_9PROT|nr:hypothetical protein [Methylophilus aquaticus]MDP8567587.1 hypothetical protein [Methylophilus aquaticus]
MMLSYPFKRFAVAVLMGLFFAATLFYVWRAQQPQVVVDAPQPLQCVSYAPFYKPGMNPTIQDTYIDPLQIERDLKALSVVTQCVRTYSVSQGMDYVPKAAQKLGMQVLLGTWIGWLDAENRVQLQLAVQLANEFKQTVKGLIVGNEVLLRGEQPEAKMHEYLQWAQANTEVSVTYADVWEFWLRHPTLEQDVDFITVHILPYWEDLPVAIAQAVPHTVAVMNRVQNSFKKPVLIGETGWPSQGRQRFAAAPSLVNEARYVREFLQAAHTNGWQYNIIEAVDQPWKRELEGTVGGYWGLFDVDLKPKFAMQGSVSERYDGLLPYVISLCLAMLAAVWAWRRRLPLSSQLLVIFTAATFGLHGFLQVDYVQHAARMRNEYLMLGGLVLLGWGLLWLQVRQLLNMSSSHGLEQGMLLLFAGALFAVSVSLGINGRYIDFPLVLTLLPVIVVLITLIYQYGQYPRAMQSGKAFVWLLAVLTLIATNIALGVAMLELGNTSAWMWAGLCGLAAFVLPAKSMLTPQAAIIPND